MKKLFCYLLPASFIFCLSFSAEDNTILVIGSSLDLSRGVWTEGHAVQEGINAVFDNARLPNMQLTFDPRDDGYMPEKARETIKQFISENINILLMPMGSETFLSYVNLIKEGKVLALFPSPGIPDRHDSSLRYCIYLRPSYYDQAAVLATYIIKTFKPRSRKIVLFYQDDAFGNACLEGAQSIFEVAGIKTVAVNYQRNNMNLASQAKQIKTENADAIGLFCTAIAAKELIAALGLENIQRWKLFAIDDVWQDPMKQYIKQKGITIVISNVVPNPEKSDIDLVSEYRSRVKKPNTYSLEGYVGASVLVDILSRLQKPVTNEKIIAACEALGKYELKGFALNFNSKKRQLINNVWINSGSDQWEKVEI